MGRPSSHQKKSRNRNPSRSIFKTHRKLAASDMLLPFEGWCTWSPLRGSWRINWFKTRSGHRIKFWSKRRSKTEVFKPNDQQFCALSQTGQGVWRKGFCTVCLPYRPPDCWEIHSQISLAKSCPRGCHLNIFLTIWRVGYMTPWPMGSIYIEYWLLGWRVPKPVYTKRTTAWCFQLD